MRIAFFIFLAATIVGSACFLIRGTPEAAFHDFQTSEHKESYLVMPLCIAGDKVVPLVIEKVKNKDLGRRRYAIGFLGTAGNDAPVPVLEHIAYDDSELEYYRADALEALFVLHEKKGLAAASGFKDRPDLTGAVSRKLLAVSDHSQFKLDYRKSTCEPDD